MAILEVFSCTGSEGLVDDGSSEPHAVCPLGATLPSPALFSFLRVLLCHVTKKYNIYFSIQKSSPFYNSEASNFLIKYQVLLNTARIVPDGNVVNQLCCSSNFLHEYEKHIFKI